MQPTSKMYAGRMISAVVFAAALMAGLPGVASDAMPVAQQNALVQKYCAVCHADARMNGGLSLEHFDAAQPDPSLVAMIVSKVRDGGAISAAGLPRPDSATQNALLTALLTESAGAGEWSMQQIGNVFTASIVRQVPGVTNAPKTLRG